DHLREVLVHRLLLQDRERADDAHARLDQRRELTREDLQRLRVDLVEEALAGSRLRARRGELLRQQAALAQQVARRLEVGGVELALELDPLSVDRLIAEGGHLARNLRREWTGGAGSWRAGSRFGAPGRARRAPRPGTGTGR